MGGVPNNPKSHCKNGHPRTPENVTPSRNCRICDNQRHQEYRRNDPARYKGYGVKGVQELTDGYVNQLIRAKTGLAVNEITEAGRTLWRARLRERRQRSQRRQAADTATRGTICSTN